MIKELKYTKQMMQVATTSSSQEEKRMFVVPLGVLRSTGINASAHWRVWALTKRIINPSFLRRWWNLPSIQKTTRPFSGPDYFLMNCLTLRAYSGHDSLPLQSPLEWIHSNTDVMTPLLMILYFKYRPSNQNHCSVWEVKSPFILTTESIWTVMS